MDMCMLDVTDVPDVKVGDVATLFGQDGDAFLPLEEQADTLGTIQYELLCSVSPRVPRVYLD
jgi:alanine racemase